MKFKHLFMTGLLTMSAYSHAGTVASFSGQNNVQNEMIISFEGGVSKAEKEAIIQDKGAILVKHLKTNNSALVRIDPKSSNFLSAPKSFAEDQDVVKVGPNKIFNLFETTPDDSKLNRQYHHTNIQSYEAWSTSVGTKDVTVAVIDTGIILDHEDLAANLWSNPGETGIDANGNDKSTNNIDDDNNGYVDDYRGWDFVSNDNSPNDENGHGTHCAGLVGAVGDNGVGVAGVSWNVNLVALKIFGASGSATEADIVEAIEYSTMMGFKLSNNSWGGPAGEEYGEGTNDLIYEAIKAGTESGQLFIFAAGNSSGNSDIKPLIPAAYDLDGIVSVAASTKTDGLAGFSNYGLTTVDIAAPGAGIFSTFKKSLFGGPYSSLSGTSMASPIVAGAAALIQSVYPDATASEIKAKLLDTVDPIKSLEGKIVTGGRLNVYRAITE